ncbi:hypothetical protein [Kitasatospora sp. NPDC101183]|uniref:hypothetical protein n=1 Tax=Kitasatospora sp. NPDC101183 TaxID=3364100 RepID=UPI00382F16BB
MGEVLAYWWLLPAVIYGCGGLAERGRKALRTRHTRKLQLLEAAHAGRLALAEANRPPEPVCGCTHHLAVHDDQGRCHEESQTPVAWDADGRPFAYELRACACRRYVGPEPLGTVFAPELVDPR